MDILTNIQNTLMNKMNNTDKSSLLNQQQISQKQLTDLLEQSTNALMCGPNCQKEKKMEELKQKYLDAETNLKSAPMKLEQSKKQYYEEAKGVPFYNAMQEKELTKRAEEISNKLQNTFDKEVRDAKTMNSYLKTAQINSQYTVDLLKEYSQKRHDMKKDVVKTHGSILTNDRKTYYETDATHRLKQWYSFLWYIYYIMFIMVFLIFLYVPINMTIFKKLIILLLVIFYPYFIYPLIQKIYHLMMAFVNSFPKNVYNNL